MNSRHTELSTKDSKFIGQEHLQSNAATTCSVPLLRPSDRRASSVSLLFQHAWLDGVPVFFLNRSVPRMFLSPTSSSSHIRCNNNIFVYFVLCIFTTTLVSPGTSPGRQPASRLFSLTAIYTCSAGGKSENLPKKVALQISSSRPLMAPALLCVSTTVYHPRMDMLMLTRGFNILISVVALTIHPPLSLSVTLTTLPIKVPTDDYEDHNNNRST